MTVRRRRCCDTSHKDKPVLNPSIFICGDAPKDKQKICMPFTFRRAHPNKLKTSLPWLVGVFGVDCPGAAVWVAPQFSPSPPSPRRTATETHREELVNNHTSNSVCQAGRASVVAVTRTLAADRSCSWCKWLRSVSCLAWSFSRVCSWRSLCCSFSFCTVTFLRSVKEHDRVVNTHTHTHTHADLFPFTNQINHTGHFTSPLLWLSQQV